MSLVLIVVALITLLVWLESLYPPFRDQREEEDFWRWVETEYPDDYKKLRETSRGMYWGDPWF